MKKNKVKEITTPSSNFAVYAFITAFLITLSLTTLVSVPFMFIQLLNSGFDVMWFAVIGIFVSCFFTIYVFNYVMWKYTLELVENAHGPLVG